MWCRSTAATRATGAWIAKKKIERGIRICRAAVHSIAIETLVSLNAQVWPHFSHGPDKEREGVLLALYKFQWQQCQNDTQRH